MRRIRLLAALAGSACAMLTVALAQADPASAAPASPHLTATVVPREGVSTTTSVSLFPDPAVADFDQEAGLSATFVIESPRGPVNRGVVDIRTVLADGTTVDLCSNIPVGSNGVGSCSLTNGELPPGGYQVIAHYEGVVGSLEHSDSGPVPLTVRPEPTTVTMTHPSASVPFGQESEEPFTLQVVPRTSGTAAGLAGVRVAKPQLFIELCNATLINGTGSCAPSDVEFPPGSYQIFGRYTSDGTFAGADTPLETFTVTPGNTTTTLALSQSRIAVDQQQSEKLSAQVVQVDGGTPTGSVAFKDGSSTICKGFLGSNGQAGCLVPTGQLAIGSHQIVASYSGDTNFAAKDSDPQTLTITAAAATTSLTLSAPQVPFGREQSEKLTVDVTGTGLLVPSGMVTIKDGDNAIATLSLADGAATKTLAAIQLKPGSHTLTADYLGDAAFGGSSSAAQTLTIAREPTTTALTLSTAKIKAGHERAENLTVNVTPKFTGPAPAGQVTINAGATRLCVITLSHAMGSCTLSRNRLRPGTYHLTATYAGRTPYAGSASARKSLAVTK
jgi:hypothetical protein